MLDRRRFLQYSTAAAVSAAWPLAGCSQSDGKPWNVLYLIADDLND